MKDVIVINRDEASKACAEAVEEMLEHLNIPEDNPGTYALKLMELTILSAMIVSNLFEEEGANALLHH